MAHTIENATATATAESEKETKDSNATANATATAQLEERLSDARPAALAKQRSESRPIHLVAPGTHVALGEKKREAAARAEESDCPSGRMAGKVSRAWERET